MSSAARSRRPFAYQADPDSDSDLDEAMDETTQDQLISTLQSQSSSTDALYIKAFTVLPLACIPAYLFYLFQRGSTGSVRTLCLLCITSLCGSSLAMYLCPNPGSQVDGSDAQGEEYEMMSDAERERRREVMARQRALAANVVSVPFVGEMDTDGPLGRVLPWLNPAICVLLALAGWGLKDRSSGGYERGGVPEGFWLFCLLPGMVLGVTTFARRSMMEVQDEIGELKGLRYGYKGA